MSTKIHEQGSFNGCGTKTPFFSSPIRHATLPDLRYFTSRQAAEISSHALISCVCAPHVFDRPERKMGRKKNKSAPKSAIVDKKVKESETEEFQLDLKALDGYDLPNSDDEQSDTQSSAPAQQPKRKRSKSSTSGRGKILGVDYREREERRLEQLLFGELIKKFEQDSQIQPAEKLEQPPSKQAAKKAKKDDQSSADGGTLPDDKFGNQLNGKNTSQRKAAWVDDDDEQIRYMPPELNVFPTK